MKKVINEIDKERVSTLNFPTDEVLTSNEAKKERILNLRKASVLGNIYHTKMKIIFKDSMGFKRVNTTVWASTEKHVILKGSNLIPLNRILDIY